MVKLYMYLRAVLYNFIFLTSPRLPQGARAKHLVENRKMSVFRILNISLKAESIRENTYRSLVVFRYFLRSDIDNPLLVFSTFNYYHYL